MKENNTKKIMFIDDQWCRKNNQCILRAEYGPLTREGYGFLHETAFDGTRYNTEKVVDRIRNESPIHTIVLDMSFTAETDSSNDMYFGKALLQRLKEEYPKLPVIMHSSSTDKDLVEECIELGAKTWLEKKATLKEMRYVLN